MDRTKSLEAINTVVGGPALSTVNRTFACMAIAEDVIATSGCSPAQGSEAFRVMCPSPVLRGKDPSVYRAHCDELIDRVLNGQSTDPATEAEVLCHLLDAALTAPLNAAGCALADHLFRRVMPGHVMLGEPLREVYEGQVAQDLAEARRRCAPKSRAL